MHYHSNPIFYHSNILPLITIEKAFTTETAALSQRLAGLDELLGVGWTAALVELAGLVGMCRRFGWPTERGLSGAPKRRKIITNARREAPLFNNLIRKE